MFQGELIQFVMELILLNIYIYIVSCKRDSTASVFPWILRISLILVLIYLSSGWSFERSFQQGPQC